MVSFFFFGFFGLLQIQLISQITNYLKKLLTFTYVHKQNRSPLKDRYIQSE